MFIGIARRMSGVLHRIAPGKIQADVLLVSNERTRLSLPKRTKGRVIEFVENGVELDIWQRKAASALPGPAIRFIYLGRLVDWKAVDLLIKAFARASTQIDATLEIIGDGELRGKLQALADSLNVKDRINFAGWMSQSQAAERLGHSDVFVLPSLYECGGAVVLEAMAVGLPVIATRWGGPADYVDSSCGILIEPSSEENLVNGMAEAMIHLTRSPETRRQMGAAGRARVEEHFTWDKKVDALLEIFTSLSKPKDLFTRKRQDKSVALDEGTVNLLMALPVQCSDTNISASTLRSFGTPTPEND
jgi:glycosyltransferase involved in cell wall biosynthesis